MNRLAQELTSRHHTVLILAMDGAAGWFEGTGIPVQEYALPTDRPVPREIPAGALAWVKSDAGACDALIDNYIVMGRLQAFQADLMLGYTYVLCTRVLAAKLDIALIDYSPLAPLDPLHTSIYSMSNRRTFLPNPLSYVPQACTGNTSQRMAYLQRLTNVDYFVMTHFDDFTLVRPGQTSFYKKHGVNLAAPQEARRLIMHIFSADFALEWVRPLPPNVKFVGPILPQPAQALPDKLEAFLEEAGDQGVLYVAMGTVDILSLEQRKAMAAAFVVLPVKVLWRLSQSEVPDEPATAELKHGNNTKVGCWMPQNDVLGHPRVKAFLSHCGTNSMYEAAYHGVPIVGLPFSGDQPDNAAKVVAKGMGVGILQKDIATQAFEEALRKVVTEPRYTAAARKVSQKLRARKRTPVEEAADWVEHVLETDIDPYLRTPEEELSFVVRHNLDVIASVAILYLASCKLCEMVTTKIGLAIRAWLKRGQKGLKQGQKGL
ncbi:g11062 [Coccomyxa viridis]|uniref:Glycosyltransferase n=1 Tax=Coccomyxa viridis TaxID=1274662 RepID=A0ABP1G886_9CHLO